MPISLELTDGLGRVWDLTAPTACPAALAGMKGLGRPAMAKIRGASNPALHGTRWAGWRATERQVVLPLGFDAGPGQVASTVRAFAEGIVPEQPGMPGPGRCVLTAILPDSSRWQLDMWLTDDDGISIDTDPELVGSLDITTMWDASVFWQGPAWSGSWQASAPVSPWMMTSGGVAALSSSHTLAGAATTNAGDVRVWPVWTITGPCTAASLGVDGHTVTLATTLTAGQQVTIDTDPEMGQTAIRDDGTDLTSSLTAVDFAPIQPGTTTLAITLNGTGRIGMVYRPRRLAIL